MLLGRQPPSFRRMDRRIWINITVLFLGTICFISLFHLDINVSNQLQEKSSTPAYILNIVNSSYVYHIQDLSKGDYSTLINLTNFQFLMMTNCTNTTFLLILVHSAADHIGRRNSIRDTWGSQHSNYIKLVFVIGKVLNKQLQSQLENEQQTFNDILQGNFYDSYRNMTYKHTMSLKYAIYHCPQATYILKVDDDVFVNVPFLLNFLNLELSPFGTQKFLFCVPHHFVQVSRSHRSKWRVSYREYPDKYFPTYCPGWAVLYSPDVLFSLYKAVQKSKYFWIDDVVITGILAKQENIFHTNMQAYILTVDELNTDILKNHKNNMSFIFSPPNLMINEIYMLWNIFQNCTIQNCDSNG